ncbi:MAG TPA: chemotaxis protein CheD [Chryseosolibacter sp.]
MQISPRSILLDHFLYPSALFASCEPARVQTILGSCVAVCLYDTLLAVGGINHFMLPHWTGQGMPSPKYGDIAVKRLIEKMNAFGSEKQNMVAKIFGGAEQLGGSDGSYNIGTRNVAVAENILAAEGISIISRSTGGVTGRKIVFYTHSNKVLVKMLKSM